MKISLLLFLVFNLGLQARAEPQTEDSAQAKSRPVSKLPQHDVPVGKVISYLQKQGKKADAAEKLALLVIAREGLGLKGVRVYGSVSDEAALAALSSGVLAGQISDLVMALPDWSKKASSKVVDQIKSHRALIQQTFNSNVLPQKAEPWFLHQLGEDKEAKESLNALFAAEKSRILAADYHVTAADAEALAAALKSLSSAEEAKAIDADLQQIKVHVSNVREHQIMT